jgi:hypothetical protein
LNFFKNIKYGKKKKIKIKISPEFNFIINLYFHYYLLHIFFKFKEIKIENGDKNYFKFETKNKTLYESILTAKELTNQNPQIKKIKIKKDIFNNRLIFEIKASDLIFKICDPKKCFYLDNYGEIIESKTYSQKKLPLIYSYLEIRKNSLIHPKIREFLEMFLEYSNWKPFLFKEIRIYHNFDISVIDTKDREFIFDPNKDIVEQLKKLEIFIQKNIQAQRIDLRIKKKIFFK